MAETDALESLTKAIQKLAALREEIERMLPAESVLRTTICALHDGVAPLEVADDAASARRELQKQLETLRPHLAALGVRLPVLKIEEGLGEEAILLNSKT